MAGKQEHVSLQELELRTTKVCYSLKSEKSVFCEKNER
jgi:hypothetical protein